MASNITLSRLQIVGGVITSAGAADANKVPILNSNGLLDPSFISGGGGGVTWPLVSTDNKLSFGSTAGTEAYIDDAGNGLLQSLLIYGTAAFNTDGSASLASDNVAIDSSGNITLSGSLYASSGLIWADVNNRIIYDQYNERAISTVSDTWNTDNLTTLISDPDYGYVAINGQLYVRENIQLQPFNGTTGTQLNTDGSASLAGGGFTIDVYGDTSISGDVNINYGCGITLNGGGDISGPESITGNNAAIMYDAGGVWNFPNGIEINTAAIDLNPDGSAQFAGGTFNIGATGALTMLNGDLIITNESVTAHMRLSEKSNGEVTWAYNVDPNNSDALDDASDMAWKFAMAGSYSTSSIDIQSTPANTGSWSGTKIWSISSIGALWMDSGAIITDGSGNMQWGNGESGYATVVNSTGELQYPYNNNLLTDTSGRLYYSSGVTLADNAANLYYGDGISVLTTSSGVLNYSLNSMYGNVPLLDESGDILYNHGGFLADYAGRLYYGDGNVMTDPTITPNELYYPGLGAAHPLADSYGILYWGGDGGGHPLADNYDILYLRGMLQDSTSSNGSVGQGLIINGDGIPVWSDISATVSAGSFPVDFEATQPIFTAASAPIFGVDENGNSLMTSLTGNTGIGFDSSGNISFFGTGGATTPASINASAPTGSFTVNADGSTTLAAVTATSFTGSGTDLDLSSNASSAYSMSVGYAATAATATMTEQSMDDFFDGGIGYFNISNFINDAGYSTFSPSGAVAYQGDNVSEFYNDAGYITGGSFLAPGDNISELDNDAGYIALSFSSYSTDGTGYFNINTGGSVYSGNNGLLQADNGTLELNNSSIYFQYGATLQDQDGTGTIILPANSGTVALVGDNVSELTNDADYIVGPASSLNVNGASFCVDPYGQTGTTTPYQFFYGYCGGLSQFTNDAGLAYYNDNISEFTNDAYYVSDPSGLLTSWATFGSTSSEVATGDGNFISITGTLTTEILTTANSGAGGTSLAAYDSGGNLVLNPLNNYEGGIVDSSGSTGTTGQVLTALGTDMGGYVTGALWQSPSAGTASSGDTFTLTTVDGPASFVTVNDTSTTASFGITASYDAYASTGVFSTTGNGWVFKTGGQNIQITSGGILITGQNAFSETPLSDDGTQAGIQAQYSGISNWGEYFDSTQSSGGFGQVLTPASGGTLWAYPSYGDNGGPLIDSFGNFLFNSAGTGTAGIVAIGSNGSFYYVNGDYLTDASSNLYSNLTAGSIIVSGGSNSATVAATDDTSTPTNIATPAGYTKVNINGSNAWIPYYR